MALAALAATASARSAIASASGASGAAGRSLAGLTTWRAGREGRGVKRAKPSGVRGPAPRNRRTAHLGPRCNKLIADEANVSAGLAVPAWLACRTRQRRLRGPSSADAAWVTCSGTFAGAAARGIAAKGYGGRASRCGGRRRQRRPGRPRRSSAPAPLHLPCAPPPAGPAPRPCAHTRWRGANFFSRISFGELIIRSCARLRPRYPSPAPTPRHTIAGQRP